MNWISIFDSQPSDDSQVLFSYKNAVYKGTYSEIASNTLLRFFQCSELSLPVEAIWWQPLPDPYYEEEEEEEEDDS
jgi:hypothetical protein